MDYLKQYEKVKKTAQDTFNFPAPPVKFGYGDPKKECMYERIIVYARISGRLHEDRYRASLPPTTELVSITKLLTATEGPKVSFRNCGFQKNYPTADSWWKRVCIFSRRRKQTNLLLFEQWPIIRRFCKWMGAAVCFESFFQVVMDRLGKRKAELIVNRTIKVGNYSLGLRLACIYRFFHLQNSNWWFIRCECMDTDVFSQIGDCVDAQYYVYCQDYCGCNNECAVVLCREFRRSLDCSNDFPSISLMKFYSLIFLLILLVQFSSFWIM